MNKLRNLLMRLVLTITAASFLSACASEIPRNPVPLEYYDHAEVVDMPGVRMWGDRRSTILHDDLVQSIENEKKGLFPRGPDGEFLYAGLSLSGGGDHGAFGAGFLQGWTKSGTRPRFKVVTGISTGALIAPFAMLGSDYDEVIEKAYTTVSADDIYKMRFIVSAFWNESLADNHPLEHLVHEIVTDQVIDAVGLAHRNGQRLFIGTTNFDVQRPVIWNMGAVANSEHPEAYKIFRQVLVASASIPVFFPPVLVEVEANGVVYDEMHVDGGTVGQMFFYGATLDWQSLIREVSGEDDPKDHSVLYVIVDGEVDPEPEHVRRRLMPIAERTISTLVKVSAWSALYRMYLHAQEGGYGFRYVGLPDDYVSQSSEPYDPEEMSRMFDIGYELGLKGESWRSILPGF